MNDERKDVEAEFDSFIEKNKALLESLYSGRTAINPERLKNFQTALSYIEKSVSGTGLRISERLFKPIPTRGTIEICGNNIEIHDTKLFMKAMDLATNVDAMAQTDGKISIGICFSGLAKEI